MNFTSPKITITALVLLTSHFFVSAQTPQTKPSVVQYDGGTRPSIEVMVEPEAKKLKKAWSDFMEERYDIKMKGIGWFSNKDVLTAEEVKFDAISSNKLDFHTKIVDTKEGTRMEVFAAEGYDIYVGPEDRPKEFARMDTVMQDFLDYYIPKYYAEKVEKQSEQVEDLADEQVDIEQAILNMEEEITDLKTDIKSLEESMKSEETDLEETTRLLEQERAKLKKLEAELAALRQ